MNTRWRVTSEVSPWSGIRLWTIYMPCGRLYDTHETLELAMSEAQRAAVWHARTAGRRRGGRGRPR